MKTLLITFLLFNTSLFGQTKEESKMVIYPGCEKFEKHGNQELMDCFSKKINKGFLIELENLLAEINLKITQVKIDAKVKFQINADGEFVNLEIDGTEDDKILLKKAFINYALSLKEKNIVIKPAVNNRGEKAKISFNIPYKIN